MENDKMFIQDEVNRVYAKATVSEFEQMVQSDMEKSQTPQEYWAKKLDK